MDQNLIRTDLLPPSVTTGALVFLACSGIAAWIFCHWALRRWGSAKFGVWSRALFALPVGVAGGWLALQAVARFCHLATPWPLFLSAVVAAVSLEAVSAFYAHECARVSPRTAKLLVFCRMAAVVTALFVLQQPVVVGERERTVNRRVVVLVDDSSSMQFRDTQLSDAEREDLKSALGLDALPEEGMTRAEMIRRLLAVGGGDSFLEQVKRKYALDVFRFGNGLRRLSSFDEEVALDAQEENFRSATDMTRALEQVLKEVPSEEISSIVIFTDGRHNGEAGVESVARRFGGAGIAVSTVVIGGSVKPFDLAVAAANSPESVFLGDKVRFAVTVSATRANGRRSKVRLFRETEQDGAVRREQLDEQEFAVEGEDWRKDFRFTDEPEEKGVYRYAVEVEGAEGEFFPSNNVRSLDVAVSDDRTNVLLVDNRPRWEYRYLRNLFYGRDKSVHLQDWLVHPDTIDGLEPTNRVPASAARPFGESEAGGFPVDLDAWRQFDVIILGDIGEDVLSPSVVESIRTCVEDRGALLVLISGADAMPARIHDAKLRDLMPVEFEPDDVSHRDAPEDAFRFSLTAAGRGHVVMNQSSSVSENEDIWQNVADFHWRLPVAGVKPGAEVLAYAQPKNARGVSGESVIAESIAATIEEDPESALRRLEEMRTEQNRNALVTAVARGKGKVLMLTTDSMWRLRSKSGDEHHHRFWGQVMRWGAGERMRAGNAHVRIGTDQLRYGAGETVKAYARLLDERYNGVSGLQPRLALKTPDPAAPAISLTLVQRPDANGFYECEIPGCTAPGSYTLTLECPDAQQKLGELYPVELSTDFIVATAKNPSEDVEIAATRETAERIAKATDGRVMSPKEFVGLDGDFGGGSKRISDRVEYPLWSLPPLFVLIVVLLSVEWIVRKKSSLA